MKQNLRLRIYIFCPVISGTESNQRYETVAIVFGQQEINVAFAHVKNMRR